MLWCHAYRSRGQLPHSLERLGWRSPMWNVHSSPDIFIPLRETGRLALCGQIRPGSNPSLGGEAPAALTAWCRQADGAAEMNDEPCRLPGHRWLRTVVTPHHDPG